MRITHFGHACVRVGTVLIDPGAFSPGFETATDLTAVLVTHDHFDHYDADRLPALLAANPGATLYAAAGADVPGAVPLSPGDILDSGGTRVEVVGGTHAVIHRDIPVVPNVGLLIDDGAFYHPGDSFHLPGRPIDTLAVPISGPWLKLGEAVDFLRAVAPRRAAPIHERALANPRFAADTIRSLTPTGTAFEEFEPA